MTQRILIGGHRGLGATDSEAARAQYRDEAELAPENTLESLIGAFVAGADFIEFDVVPARDGLVVTHSAKLADHIFPPPAGADYTAQLALETLTMLTVGHRGDAKDRIPTLQALLVAAKPHLANNLTGTRFLNLEIKGLQGTGESFGDTAQTGFITAILHEVHSAGLLGQTLFSSFRAVDLRILRGMLPSARLAQLFIAKDEPGCLTFTQDNMETVLRVTPGITLHLPLSRFSDDDVPAVPAEATVNIWQDQVLPLATVLQQCREAAVKLAHLSQLGFITDYPVELKAAFTVEK